MALPQVDIVGWFEKASVVPRGTRLLDRAMWQVVPFNLHVQPRVISVTADEAVTEVKLRRGLKNHVGSMHAAVLVTVAEYGQGLVILANAGKLGAEMIIKHLEIEYLAKAKGTVTAKAVMTSEVRNQISAGLAKGDNAEVVLTSELFDKDTGVKLAIFKGTWKARRPK